MSVIPPPLHLTGLTVTDSGSFEQSRVSNACLCARCVCVCVCANMCVCECFYLYICMYVIYMYIYICICVLSSRLPNVSLRVLIGWCNSPTETSNLGFIVASQFSMQHSRLVTNVALRRLDHRCNPLVAGRMKRLVGVRYCRLRGWWFWRSEQYFPVYL